MAWPGPTMQSYAKAHDHTRGRSPATSPLNHVRQLIAPVQLAFCLQHDGRVRTCIGPKSWVGTGTPGLNVRAGKVWSSSASVASHGSAQQERSLDAVPVTTAHSASAAPDTVQVTHFNFWQQLPRVQEALKNCSFFAFDCEFTGLCADKQSEDNYLDDYEERYWKLYNTANSFMLCQFGLSAFRWVPVASSGSSGNSTEGARSTGGYYEATTFNFSVFPQSSDDQDKRFMCQASSLQFLAKAGFDFNRFVYGGVPYMHLSSLVSQRAALGKEAAAGRQQLAAALQDEALAAHIAQVRSEISAWLHQGASEALELAPASTRACEVTRLLLRYEYSPAGQGTAGVGREVFSVDSITSGQDGQVSLVIESLLPSQRPTPDEEDLRTPSSEPLFTPETTNAWTPSLATSGSASLSACSTDESSAAKLQNSANDPRVDRLSRDAGMALVLEAMRDCNRPAVGHNAILDVFFTIHHFGEPLPKASWQTFKALIPQYFPGGLYDTKYLSQQLQLDRHTSNGNSALGSLFSVFGDCCGEGGTPADNVLAGVKELRAGRVPRLVLAPGSGAYAAAAAQVVRQRIAAKTGSNGNGSSSGATVVAGAHGQVVTHGSAGSNTESQSGVTSSSAAVRAVNNTPVAASSKAHEAGFDAFMTGAVYARFLRLAEVRNADRNGASATSASSSSSAASSATSAASSSTPESMHATEEPHPAALKPMQDKLHMRYSDLDYYDLSGPDPVPSRPDVLHVTGLKPYTRASFLYEKCREAGLTEQGKNVRVAVLNSQNSASAGSTSSRSPPTASFFVRLPQGSKGAVHAAPLLKKRLPKDAQVTPYSEYVSNRRKGSMQKSVQRSLPTNGSTFSYRSVAAEQAVAGSLPMKSGAEEGGGSSGTGKKDAGLSAAAGLQGLKQAMQRSQKQAAELHASGPASAEAAEGEGQTAAAGHMTQNALVVAATGCGEGMQAGTDASLDLHMADTETNSSSSSSSSISSISQQGAQQTVVDALPAAEASTGQEPVSAPVAEKALDAKKRAELLLQLSAANLQAIRKPSSLAGGAKAGAGGAGGAAPGSAGKDALLGPPRPNRKGTA